MITLSKSGNTITFTFDENSGYLQNGTIDVPVNSLALIIDESDMATFRKSASNDIFISARYEEFGMSKAELEAWYKENMVGSTGGGVDSGTVQTMIDTSTANYFDNAEYDSGTTRINFYHGNTVKVSLDASQFVIDGMIDDVRIETISGVSYLVIDFNTASGKEDIQIPLTDIFDPSNYYTKTEVDASLSGKADTTAVTEAISAATDDMATKTWVGEQGYLTEHQSLSAYSTTEEVNSAITEATSGKVDTSTYNTYTANTATEIGNKLAVSDFNSYSGAVDTAINSKASESDLSALTDVVSAHTANTDIHVTTAQTAAWNAKSDFSGSYNDLTDKPTIPTSASQLTNDAGYITEDALSGYAESSAVTEEIAAAVSGKQDTLIEGRAIDITNNTVSFDLPISAGTGTNSIIENEASNDASGGNSHAEGYSTKASGVNSHAEGSTTTASGNCAHAEGAVTTASGQYSHAEGFYTIASNRAEHASGQWNVSSSGSSTFGDSGNTLFSIGNGTNDNTRHNAFEIRQNGDIYISSGNTDIKLQDNLGGGGVTVDSAFSRTSENPVQNKVISNNATNGDGTVSSSSGRYKWEFYSVGGVGTNKGFYLDTINGETVVKKYNNTRSLQLVETSAITTSITSGSTDSQVPSAKAVNDKLGGLSLVKLTQSAYDALSPNYDSNTLYVIVN